MNEQKPPNAIEWTRVWGRRGYTWNVVGGCLHKCRWEMPTGDIAICYAESTAEGVAQKAYPQGFAHHYWHPERLDEPLRLKEPTGIFLDSMSDLMGHWVEDEQIQSVLDVCARADWHIFMLLTKNAPRLRKFKFPTNVWVGVSSPPDFYKGSRLMDGQRERFLERSLEVLFEVDAKTRWMSFEPLSIHAAPIVALWQGALDWAVIGAASNGKREFAPDTFNLQRLVEVLDAQQVPVFYKGNLRSSEWATEHWREEFPEPTHVTPMG